jgi:hypothetical protein
LDNERGTSATRDSSNAAIVVVVVVVCRRRSGRQLNNKDGTKQYAKYKPETERGDNKLQLLGGRRGCGLARDKISNLTSD